MIQELPVFWRWSLLLFLSSIHLPAMASWQLQTSSTRQDLNGLDNNGSRYVAVGDSSVRINSNDGINWGNPPLAISVAPLNDVTFNQGLFVAVGNQILTSPDGTIWTVRTLASFISAFNGVVSNGSRFVAVGAGGNRARSDDGLSWTVGIGAAETPDLFDVAANASVFVEVGSGGIARTSPDGITWTTRTTPTNNNLFGVTWTGSQFIAVGASGTILTSPNGSTWTTRTSGTTQALEDVYFNGTKHIAAGRNSTILLSDDGITWSSVTNSLAKEWLGISSIGNVNILVGSGGSIARCVSPTITSQPSSASVCPGTNLTLTLQASGTGLTFQWQKNGVDITGANKNELQLTGVGPTDVAAYRCMVSNGCGMVASTIANVSLLNPVSITSRPANQTRCPGDNTSFTVVANGSGPITYQWRKNGTNIPGANAATLNLSNLVSGDAGNYDCLVSGPCNSASSGTASLSIRERVGISSNPSGLTLCLGENAVFSVVATGTGPITYQWRKNAINIPGENGSSLTLSSISSADAANYSCVISGPCRNVLSTSVPLVVRQPPSVDSHPQNATACSGDPASFSVTASGAAPISYQWRKNGTNIPGATSATLNLAGVTPADQASYTCVMTNPCDSTISNPATLTINQPAAIDQNPQPLTVCSGENATFSISATGVPAPSFQWRKNGIDIPGATSATLNLGATAPADQGTYTCRVTNACTTIVSGAALLTVNQPAAIDQQPQPLTLCSGENATLSISVSGVPAPSFQWRKDGTDIPGATSATLNLGPAAPSDQANYTCRVTNDCSSIVSNPALLTVNQLATIDQEPQSTAICPGGTAMFSISTSGSPSPTLQWQKDGINLPGETNATLTITDLEVDDEGTYTCVVSNGCGQTVSQNANLTVDGPLTVQVVPHVKPQGLFTLSLEAFPDCVVPMSEMDWLNLATGVPFGTNQNPVDLPSLTETTRFRVSVTDDISREIATADATILVSLNPSYFDFNNDGCNTVQDLILMSEQWLMAIPDDPDGNGQINVLDYLYINVDQPGCP